MTKIKILFVENDPAFLKTRRWILESEGYEVLSAGSFNKAQHLLRNTWVHVIILDIRLTSAGGPSDTSGLTLIRESDAVIPKLILTAYPDWNNARGALVPGHCVYFLAKQDGPEAMLDSVRRAFNENVRLNRHLDIRFRGDSLLHLVEALDGSRAVRETIACRVAEMEDLLRKVFHDHTRVTLDKLSKGAGDICRLRAKAISNRGEERFTLKCGARSDISAAIQTRDQRPIYSAETLHYAAVAYKVSFWQKVQEALSDGGKGVDLLDKLVTLLNKLFR